MSEGIISQKFSGVCCKKAEEIRLRVTLEYAAEYTKASWLGKRIIQLKIQRQVRKEMKAFDPSYWV